MARLILTVIATVLPLLVNAYSITGRIIDNSEEPAAGASIALLSDSATVAGGTIADSDGRFVMRTDLTGSLEVKISMIGYATTNIQFDGTGEDVDFGVITLTETPNMLGEIVIEADNVVESGSNYIVYPTAREIAQSRSSVDLLETLQYKLPGLQVNSAINRIKVENGDVIFQINGRKVDFSRIQSLNNDNILRIDYANVSDIRYGTSVMGVINFITKPVAKGGSLLVNTMASLKLADSSVGGTFNYGKSEWSLDYGNIWRDFDKIYSSSTENFIGRRSPVTRENLPKPSSFDNAVNSLSLGYTYMHDESTMLAMTLGGKFSSDKEHTYNQMIQTDEYGSSQYSSSIFNKNHVFNPSMDIYFRKQLNDRSKFEWNVYGNMGSGDYIGTLDYNSDSYNYSQSSATDNTAYRIGSELLYSRSYNNFEMKYGVNYYHNYAKNIYNENVGDEQTSRQNNDNVYVHSSITGRINAFSYSAGIGGRYFHTDNGLNTLDAFKLSGKATLNYKINRYWSVNYLFMLDPSMPSLTSTSNLVQRIDDITYQVGSPDIKASTYFRNRIYVRYATPQVNISLWAAHSRNINPIYNRYTYVSDPQSPHYDFFMVQSNNAKHNDLWNAELNFGFTGIRNLVIYAVGGWDRYSFSGFGDIEPFSKFYANLNVVYALKNWRFLARYDILPRYSLSSNVLSSAERVNAVGVQYSWRDFWFSLYVENPFTKNGVSTKREELSQVHPVVGKTYIKDCANMVMIGVTYRVNFGKSFKKAEQELQNHDIDTGTNTGSTLNGGL